MNIQLQFVSHLTQFKSPPALPGDKSISHRSLLFGALAEGKTEIFNLLMSGDIQSTWNCLEKLGIQITRKGNCVTVLGRGLRGLHAPTSYLDCGNSGTSFRLLMGILAGTPFETTLIGDSSLSQRPMRRVTLPLTQMGAKIHLNQGEFAPVTLHGSQPLHAISYELPVASAQLKSALLLAGLYADGTTHLSGKIKSRDHSERLLPHFGVHIDRSDTFLSISGGQTLHSSSVQVPSDLSSAAFWIGATLIVPHSVLELENISLNPTRTGILNVLHRMGATIQTEVTTPLPEPKGRLRVEYSQLKATDIEPDEIPSLIDELPLMAVLATFAHGTTRIRGAEELRTKETDRIAAIAKNLRAMGAQLETFPDGLSILGPQPLTGAQLESFGDHRIAMAFAIAALRARGPTEILDAECVDISYPGFFNHFFKN